VQFPHTQAIVLEVLGAMYLPLDPLPLLVFLPLGLQQWPRFALLPLRGCVRKTLRGGAVLAKVVPQV
jgi:hypothetical protein